MRLKTISASDVKYLKATKGKRELPSPAKVRNKSVSNLEERFALLWRLRTVIELEREYQFAPPRKFRADFAYTGAVNVLVEIEGGTWSKSRHTTGRGYAKDAEKYNLATANGWSVFRLTGDMITAENVDMIADFIERSENLDGIGDIK